MSLAWRYACGCLCAGLLWSCAPASDTTIRFALASAPVSLDPRYATDATSTRINRLLYQRLVDFDAALRPVPSLAQWRVLAPTHYRFHIADRARFSDGTPVSARDVKVTYDYVLDAAHASPHRATLSIIERIDVVDDTTVDFVLTRADPLFPGYLVIGVLPAHLQEIGHAFNNLPVGSGPFALLAWPQEGRLILERRNDGQRVELLEVKDPTVRVLKLVRGEVDLLQNDLPPEMLAYLARRNDVAVTQAQGSNFTYLGFNLQDPVSGNYTVRRAIAHAIDRAAIIRYLLGGAAHPAQALLPPDHWAGNDALTGYAYDPAQSRALLATLGYSVQTPLKLVYKTSSDPFRLRLATVMQRQLAEVGIDVDLRSYDWGTFYGDIKAGRFQMFSLAWVGVKTPDIFRYAFHSTAVPPQGANRGRFADAEVDRLIDVAQNEPDMTQQAADYRRLQQRLLDTLPYVPLWYEDHVLAARKNIQGYALARDGNYDGLMTVQRAVAVRLAHE